MRDSHDGMDGQMVKTSERFKTDEGNYLRYPGDPEGAAGETINCRCNVLPVIEQ